MNLRFSIRSNSPKILFINSASVSYEKISQVWEWRKKCS